jgi:capsular polysaccharide biosynthesis protein
MRLRYEPTADYVRRRGGDLTIVRESFSADIAAPASFPTLEIPQPRPLHFVRPESWWGQPVSMPPAYIATLEDALCFGAGFNQWPLLVASGGVLIDDSFIVRGTNRSIAEHIVQELEDGYELTVDPQGARRMSGEYVLLGVWLAHFGHFLTEGLARAWVTRPDATYVIYEPESTPWQQAVLDTLGIERVHYVTEPTRFERLIVPSLSCNLATYFTPEIGTTYRRIRDAVPAAQEERVYLSRARFPKRRRLVNEDAVEERFKAHGFTIVHPEHLPMRDQIGLASGAAILAGTAGSNMYLGAFQAAGAKRVIVSPRAFAPSDDVLISNVVGTHLTYVFGDAAGPDPEATPPRYRDFSVDLAAVDTALEQVTARVG